MRRAWCAVLGLLVGWVPNAVAYHGGPDVFELLGWSASEQRVYWMVHGLNESGIGPCVYSRSVHPDSMGAPTRLVHRFADAWRGEPSEISALRRRLAPLAERPGPRLARVDSVRTDTLWRDPNSRYALTHHVVHGRFDRSGWRFEAVTYCRPDVYLLHDYAIPGRAQHLLVVAFIGIRYDCEETQEAVLVKSDHDFLYLEYPNRWN